jgi:hypothetical protein
LDAIKLKAGLASRRNRESAKVGKRIAAKRDAFRLDWHDRLYKILYGRASHYLLAWTSPACGDSQQTSCRIGGARGIGGAEVSDGIVLAVGRVTAVDELRRFQQRGGDDIAGIAPRTDALLSAFVIVDRGGEINFEQCRQTVLDPLEHATLSASSLSTKVSTWASGPRHLWGRGIV